MKANLGMKNLGKRSGATDANITITNKIEEIEERMSGIEDAKEDLDTSVK